MSVKPETPLTTRSLQGSEGELVSVSVIVDARHLEDLLESLAQAPFPINPEIRHGSPATSVEFPAYRTHLEAVKSLLELRDLGDYRMEVASMLSLLSALR